MSQENQDAIKEKIEALLRKAGETTTMAEAEAAMRLAQKLIVKYNIDQATLNANGQEKAEEVEHFDIDTATWEIRHEGQWLSMLMFVIAKYHFGMALKMGSTTRMRIISKKSNREMILFVYEQLINRMREVEKGAWKKYEGHEKRNSFRRAFLMGAVEGLESKLREGMETIKKEAESTALAIVTENELVKDYAHKNFRIGQARQSAGYKAKNGRQQGREAGKGMSVNRGMGSGQKALN